MPLVVPQVRETKMKDWAKHFRDVSKAPGKALPAYKSIGGAFGADSSRSYFGADSSTILQVQKKLNALGLNPPLKEDGISGPSTTSAVAGYQRTHGLTVDGMIGPQVIHSLGIIPSAPPPLPTVTMPAIKGLRTATTDHFVPFSQKFEGHTNYMYTDSKGYVTTGIGNLIDPVSQALPLPWKHADGTAASQAEIQAEFSKIKSAWPGIQSVGDKAIASLFLSDQDIAALVHGKLAQNHQYLTSQFPDIASWPADAQMAVHSISWAWGPGFASKWGNLGNAFKAAVNQAGPDFQQAADVMTQASAQEEHINPGIVPRNAANRSLFANAAAILKRGGNGADNLWWPGIPTSVGLAVAVLGSGLLYWFVGGAAVILTAMALGKANR